MQDPRLSPLAEWGDSCRERSGETLPLEAGGVQGQAQSGRHPDFIAASPAMREVRRQIEQLAVIDASILLYGESGTGKETAARMIHRLSSRAAHKFLKVNCAALSEGQLESEIFGQEAGVSAGARGGRPGKLELSDKGTLLLDGVSSMPLGPQAILLHFLQDGEFMRMGGVSPLQSDARILATAETDLRSSIRAGTLRPDLYYRLGVFAIQLPPLRERREDLPYLLNQLLTTWADAYQRPCPAITSRLLDACVGYSWPGNLRELENFARRYLVLGDEKLALDAIVESADGGSAIQAESLAEPKAMPRASVPADEAECDLKSVVRGLKQDAERAAILQALERTGGNKQEAAGLLRISLRALHYKVRAYRIPSIPPRMEPAPASSEPMTLPRAVGDNGPYELPRSGGGKIIAMNRSITPTPAR